jgi:hypothetical protein
VSGWEDTVKKLLLLLLCICGCFALTPLRAGTLAVSFDNLTGESLASGPFTLGWSITMKDDLHLFALCLFDDSQNGLAESHDVGIWDSNGSLLASTTIQSGTVDPLDSQFRVVPVSPITFLAGQTYYIGALFLDGTDNLIFPDGTIVNFATAPEMTFDANQYVAGGTLSFPFNSVGTAPGYFGPNFEFIPVNTPEPASLVLFVTGSFGIGLASWRKALLKFQ